jgi:tRNA pseudouridine55 synthase
MNSSETLPVAGIVNLYKPATHSSAQYVYRLRGVFGLRKVGHAGTLDPFADGVLLACLGRGTKLVERLMSLPKHYRTTIRLGVTNDTYDTEHPLVPVSEAVPLDRTSIETAVTSFVGEIQQVPPAFSAVKIGGVPSYKLAKQGRPAARRPRPVRIDRIDVLAYEWPRLQLDIHCGRGTYIRAIARDLGRILGCGGVCEALTRTAIGPFHIEKAVNLDTAEPDAVRAALISLAEAQRLLA